MSSIKTRFAPSPTGFLHIGGVRTALYSWLFAKKMGGKFLLRIEDTDIQRNVKEATQLIIDALNWLGIESDCEPIFQTNRIEIYQKYVNKLLNQNDAYVCHCSKQRLDEIRQEALNNKKQPKYDGFCRDKNHPLNADSVVRLKVEQKGETNFFDATHGVLKINNEQLDDMIISRQSMPTYNFSVVIDDALMEISYVIRGDDHINNTFKQIALFEKLNFKVPVFSHLPMILADDGSRLSKRNKASNVLDYQHEGFLPEAVLNYLFRLGFSSGDQEIFSNQQMMEVFDLSKINKSAASLNHHKLIWLNQHYLQNSTNEKLLQVLQNQFNEDLPPQLNSDCENGKLNKVLTMVDMQKSRAKTLKELALFLHLFYQKNPFDYDEKQIQKLMTPISKTHISDLSERLKAMKEFNQDNIHQVITQMVQTHFQGQFGKFARAVRFILTGSTPSGDLSLVMELMGLDLILMRLNFFQQNYLE